MAPDPQASEGDSGTSSSFAPSADSAVRNPFSFLHFNSMALPTTSLIVPQPPQTTTWFAPLTTSSAKQASEGDSGTSSSFAASADSAVRNPFSFLHFNSMALPTTSLIVPQPPQTTTWFAPSTTSSAKQVCLGTTGSSDVPNDVLVDETTLKKEMKRYRSIALGVLAIAFTVGFFKLSPSVVLSKAMKFYCGVVTTYMFVQAIITVAATYSSEANDLNIDLISSSLAILALYIVDSLLLITYSFAYWPHAKSSHHITVTMCLVGAGADVITFALWVNTYGRPKALYNHKIMKLARTLTWCLVKAVAKTLWFLICGIYGFLTTLLCCVWDVVKEMSKV